MPEVLLAVSQLQHAFSQWNDRGRIAGVPALKELLGISVRCVEGLQGHRRILAYVLDRMLFTILEYWEDEPVIDPSLFLKHARQPIAAAISLLQDPEAGFDSISPAIHNLIDAQKLVVV